jgi:ABC-type Fe3+/spermidine/putrescine transport system ATPase subunit
MVNEMDRSDSAVKPAISLQSISKFYKENTVIDNVSLELAKGEFLSLLGPSGSGKTTILRMVAGLVTPSEGKVILDGRDVSLIPPNQRNLGMVFQQYALFPHMTVWENVAYGLKARKMNKALIKEKVEKYLALVGLSHLASRKPRELSGGQQQRVSLARALAVEPIVMLFDEPLSNLDVRLKEQMLKEIRSLHKSIGFSAIYVTHDQNEALYLSDKIAVLNKGKVEQFAVPEEILRSPATPFVADFFGYTNRLENAVLLDGKKVRLGELEIPVGHLGENCKAGSSGIVLMRSNAVQILDYHQENGLGEQGHQAEAQVLDSRYMGGQTELKVRLLKAAEHEITVTVPRMLARLPEHGTTVKISFAAESVAFYQAAKGDLPV